MFSDVCSYSAQCVFPARACLGESPQWWPDRNLLIWVDIEQSKVGLFDPISKVNRFVDVGAHVGCAVPTDKGNLLCATSDGFYFLDPDSTQIIPLHNPEASLPNNRFNDGKCDPWGQFWVGSLSYDFMPNGGNLWRFNSSLQSTLILDSVTISNGLAWSLDYKHLFYIDSPTLQVKRFSLSKSGDLVDDGEVCIQIPADWGCVPDGMTIDSKGMLWIALWNGSAVTRWDPSTGKHLSTVSVPCPRVTSCCFGGPRLDVLYITTASDSLSDGSDSLYELAGGIFAAHVDVSGRPEHKFFECQDSSS